MQNAAGIYDRLLCSSYLILNDFKVDERVDLATDRAFFIDVKPSVDTASMETMPTAQCKGLFTFWHFLQTHRAGKSLRALAWRHSVAIPYWINYETLVRALFAPCLATSDHSEHPSFPFALIAIYSCNICVISYNFSLGFFFILFLCFFFPLCKSRFKFSFCFKISSCYLFLKRTLSIAFFAKVTDILLNTAGVLGHFRAHSVLHFISQVHIMTIAAKNSTTVLGRVLLMAILAGNPPWSTETANVSIIVPSPHGHHDYLYLLWVL